MEGDPYTFETVGREALGDCYSGLQAEYWTDSDGHFTHLALVAWDDTAGESITLMINDAAEARRLKNLLAKVERRLA